MYRVLVFLILMLTWMILSGHFDAFHLIMGAVCSGIVTWLSSDLLFEDRSLSLRTRLRQLARIASYFVWLLGQVVLANIYTLKLALSPGGLDEVAPRVVTFRTHLKSDFAKYLLAQSITLTPGTVTVKIVGDEFHIHAISKVAADGLDGSMEGWIKHIFEPEASAR